MMIVEELMAIAPTLIGRSIGRVHVFQNSPRFYEV